MGKIFENLFKKPLSQKISNSLMQNQVAKAFVPEQLGPQ
jgi:hypothetical protein